MKIFSMLTTLLVLGVISICGCERVQDIIFTEQSSMTDPMPLRVSMVYPFACLGSLTATC